LTHGVEYRLLPAKEPARTPHGQDQQSESYRLGEGAEHRERVEYHEVVAQRRAVRLLLTERLNPYGEETFH
jgi:hypothetical protein